MKKISKFGNFQKFESQDINDKESYWYQLAQALKDEFGENLVEEDGSEDDPFNWWLQDVTVLDIIEFMKKNKVYRADDFGPYSTGPND